MKAALYRRAALDAWLDGLVGPTTTRRSTALGRAYLCLLPERAVRCTPFAARSARPQATVLILTLIPPEDTGGGSRPAQLAAELHRRGFAIDWRYALPIFPWPRRRRPAVPALSVDFLDGDGAAAAPPRTLPAFALVEAPHPRLCAALEPLPGEIPVVYDAIDVWDGGLGAGWYDRACEDLLLQRASTLIASSRLLRDEIASRTGRDVGLIENGVDPRVFDPAIARPAPPDLRRGRPTVLYVGSLWGEWVDLELVEALARALPDAAVNLIGPAGTRRLPAAANIAILGPRPQHEIPAYLQAADVAIVPFTRDRLSAAVSPLKAFEYLAMAIPVVATLLPELAGVPGVTRAADTESFVAAVRAASAATFPHAAAAAFVARHTWQDRVDRLLEAVIPGERLATDRKD